MIEHRSDNHSDASDLLLDALDKEAPGWRSWPEEVKKLMLICLGIAVAKKFVESYGCIQ